MYATKIFIQETKLKVRNVVYHVKLKCKNKIKCYVILNNFLLVDPLLIVSFVLSCLTVSDSHVH